MSGALLDVSVDLLGMAVRVEVADGEAAAHVRGLIGALSPSRGSSQRTLRLARQAGGAPGRELDDGHHLVRGGMSGAEAVRTLLWYLNHLALRTDGYVVLHAGAVTLGRRGVVLPADMDVGKSTLVTALVRDGFGYLSDEFGPIGLDDGLLRPYPSPIGLDPGSFPLFPDLKPTLDAEFDDLEHWHVPVAPGWPPGSPGVPVEVIVFPSYTPGSACSVTPMGPTEAVALVANNTLNFFELGGRAFHAVSSLVREAEVYRLVFSDLEEACAMIRSVVTSVGNRDQGV